jgi:hypothetical protein
MVLAAVAPSLGATIFSTPASMEAVILSTSTVLGRTIDRENAP